MYFFFLSDPLDGMEHESRSWFLHPMLYSWRDMMLSWENYAFFFFSQCWNIVKYTQIQYACTYLWSQHRTCLPNSSDLFVCLFVPFLCMYRWFVHKSGLSPPQILNWNFLSNPTQISKRLIRKFSDQLDLSLNSLVSVDCHIG